MADLADRVALVSGAGRGIGREIALGLAAAGAKVALIARSTSELHAVASEIRSAEGTALEVVTDLSDPAQIHAAVAHAASRLGNIGVLINNAAAVGPLGATSELDPVEISRSLAVNVVAVISLTAAAIPAMVADGWGRVVNISSGIVSNPGMMVGGTVYAASKAAVEAHTINLAAELLGTGTGITVNAYRPGAVDTAMQQWIRSATRADRYRFARTLCRQPRSGQSDHPPPVGRGASPSPQHRPDRTDLGRQRRPVLTRRPDLPTHIDPITPPRQRPGSARRETRPRRQFVGRPGARGAAR